MSNHTSKVDVFICGAGPVGLILAYTLRRLNHTVHIIDSADKASPNFPMYGRASTLFARTLEMLDSLDLYDAFAQEALLSRESFTYDSKGERVYGRGWSLFEKVAEMGSFFEETMNLRLKYSEDVVRGKLEEMSVKVWAPWKLVGFEVDEQVEGDHKVLVKCVSPAGEEMEVRAKYLVGADGGSSAVRRLAEIPFHGEHKDRHWVRIDGVVKSNIPEARVGFGTIESPTHGQVLWVALDHSATRIGYALNNELFEKYGWTMTQEQAVYEAKLACAPFEVEFEQVDWHTVYGIQQRVAERLVDRGRIFLAGEAAHTHSSGLAQGMNTGVHDVFSLGWRLAGVMKGWYQEVVLQNYSDERRGSALQLIENDKIASRLISGEKPEIMKDRPEGCMALLGEWILKTGGFSLGLQISYPPNLLNDLDNASFQLNMQPGQRAVDTLVHKPGFQDRTIRLHELMKYDGKFRVIVFAGRPQQTQRSLQLLRPEVDRHQYLFANTVDYLTLIAGFGKALDEHLTVRKFGRGYWDPDGKAHSTFGVAENLGALIVVRPDGIVGACAPLEGFEASIVPYFGRMVVEQGVKNPVSSAVNSNVGVGELLNPFENNLGESRKNAMMSP